MICDEARILLGAYEDGELPADRRQEVERHLRECPECAERFGRFLKLGDAIRTQLPTYRAPDSLKPAARPVRAWPVFAGGIATGAIAFLLIGLLIQRRAVPDLTSELVSDHVRSLMADHLVDVPSSDKHTVKPWFLGKVDFSPSVPDLKDHGFPLIGGRLEYVDGHQGAALVYMRAKHVINVLVLPATVEGAPASDRDGYHIRHWKIGDLGYWAVSDVAAADLAEFEKEFLAKG